MKVPKKAVVSKRVSDEEKINAKRWCAFIHASGLPCEELTEEWWDFFLAQSEPTNASERLVHLVDRAILKDEKK